MEFTTSLDRFSKIGTIGITVLFAVIIGKNVMSGESMTQWFVSAFLILIYGFCWLCRPIKYSITNEQLIIERRLGNVKINRNNIAGVQQLEDGKLNMAIRTFGVGGLFGYFGKFYSSGIGNMTFYATRKNRVVLIATKNNQKIIVSPDEAERFVEALRKIN